MTLYSELDERT